MQGVALTDASDGQIRHFGLNRDAGTTCPVPSFPRAIVLTSATCQTTSFVRNTRRYRFHEEGIPSTTHDTCRYLQHHNRDVPVAGQPARTYRNNRISVFVVWGLLSKRVPTHLSKSFSPAEEHAALTWPNGLPQGFRASCQQTRIDDQRTPLGPRSFSKLDSCSAPDPTTPTQVPGPERPVTHTILLQKKGYLTLIGCRRAVETGGVRSAWEIMMTGNEGWYTMLACCRDRRSA